MAGSNLLESVKLGLERNPPEDKKALYYFAFLGGEPSFDGHAHVLAEDFDSAFNEAVAMTIMAMLDHKHRNWTPVGCEWWLKGMRSSLDEVELALEKRMQRVCTKDFIQTEFCSCFVDQVNIFKSDPGLDSYWEKRIHFYDRGYEGVVDGILMEGKFVATQWELGWSSS